MHILHQCILKTFLHRKPNDLQRVNLESKIGDWAQQSCIRERKARDVEREIQDLRRSQFMQDKVGQKFSGIITSVTAFGFFVELENYFVEGLVPLSSIADDYYHYIESEHKLKGQHGFKIFQIGNSVIMLQVIRTSRKSFQKRSPCWN